MGREMIVGAEMVGGDYATSGDYYETSGDYEMGYEAGADYDVSRNYDQQYANTGMVPVRGRRIMGPPPQQQQAPRRLVVEQPKHARQFPIGFMRDNVQPGEEFEIEVKPQVHFRGERLAIPPSIARYFYLLDFKVGKNSQLAAVGAMPGEAFSALAVGVRMELDTASPGITLSLRGKNIDTQARNFSAVIYGAVLE